MEIGDTMIKSIFTGVLIQSLFWMAALAAANEAQTPETSPMEPPQGLVTLDEGWSIEALVMQKDRANSKWVIADRYPIDTAVSTPIPNIDQSDKKLVAVYKRQINLTEVTDDLMLWLPDPLGYVTVSVNNKEIFRRGQNWKEGTKLGRGDSFVKLPKGDSFDIAVFIDNSAYAVRGTGFSIDVVIQKYREALDGLFGSDAGTIPVHRNDLEEVKGQVERGELKSAVHKIIFMYENNVEKILETEIASIKRLGKEPPLVLVENDNFILDQKTSNVIKKSFIHLLRNSMDHGLETAEDRVSAGKTPEGKIQISVSHQGEFLRIEYGDDGRGLDFNALRKKAEKAGLNPDGSPEELAELIFQSGMSTATAVTDISGRGVGMEAVKKFIEIEGGHVQLAINRIIENRAQISFIIDLPLNQMKQVEELSA